MKGVLKALKKHWITVWLVIAIAVSGVFAVYAAYTEVSSVKRVVSTQSTPETLFSSNCMRKDGTRKQMSTTEYNVTVCNYDQDFPGDPNPALITYTFTARLELKVGDDYFSYDKLGVAVADGGAGLSGDTLTAAQAKFTSNAEKYGVQMSEDDAGNISDDHAYRFSEKSSANYEVVYSAQTLAPNKSSTDKFKVTIPEEDLQGSDTEFFVYTEANPTDHTLLYTIYSRLYGSVVGETEATWSGKILETDCATVDYDFYNYILTGNGVGTVDVMWNPEYFEISDFFTSAASGTTFTGGTDPVNCTDEGHAGWVKLTLNVNALDTLDPDSGAVIEKGITRYEIQFYKIKENTAYTGDIAASKFIDCKFNKSQP